MKKTTLLATTMLALGITLAPAAYAAEEFAKKAAMGGEFEIKSSQLALEKSQNPAVKQFAQQMITDHTKAANDLKTAAPAAGVTPAEAPMRLDDKSAKMLKALSEKNGKDFDEAYIDDLQKSHKQAIDLYKDYAENGNNPQLKTFASTTLPVLEQHKEMADKLDDQID